MLWIDEAALIPKQTNKNKNHNFFMPDCIHMEDIDKIVEVSKEKKFDFNFFDTNGDN